MIVELPSWLRRVRQSEIVERVQHDPRSTHGTVLGLTMDEAALATGRGQADFDRPWRDLSCTDRVLLYAYLFQPGHLKELIAAFRQLFARSSRLTSPIIVDLGCGPFTGGLAVACELDRQSRFDYIGVDQSRTMLELGQRLASAATHHTGVPRISCNWSTEMSSVRWELPPGWRDVIVVVSYLLASPTLDIEALVSDLNALLAKLGRGHVTVLYTNSPRPAPNQLSPAFQAALSNAGFKLSVDAKGEIEIEKWDGPSTRKLRYALLTRQKQTTLILGGE